VFLESFSSITRHNSSSETEASIQPFCFWGEHSSKGLRNQADIELHIINAISAADIAFITSSSQAIVKLIECSRPIRFFILSLMYNNCWISCKQYEYHRARYILINQIDIFGWRVYILVATQFRSPDDSFGRLQLFSLYILSCTQLCVTNCTIGTCNLPNESSRNLNWVATRM